MRINPVSVVYTTPSFKSSKINDDKNPKTNSNPIKNILGDKDKQKEVAKISAIVVATALAATTITSLIKGKRIKNIREYYQHRLDNYERPLRNRIDDLTRQNKGLSDEVTDLRTKNKESADLNKRLQAEAQDARNKLEDVFEGDLTPAEVRSKIHRELKEKIDTATLGYDPMTPPVTGIGGTKVYADAVDLPERVKTGIRANMEALEIPEIAPDGSFHFTMPYSSEVKTSSMPSIDFTPRKDIMTNVSEGYAESVKWNNDKIARDIIQNFYDGHGQTLDGVRFHFEPIEGGKYRVRIEGDSSYTADKAIFIGESTKRGDIGAAGNYGEGLKMASLKLIRDKGAKDVRIGSDNWDLTFRLDECDLLQNSENKQVMYWDLLKGPRKSGNYIEFETDDRELLETMRKTINRFYHSGNIHFKNPDFENDLISISVLKQPTYNRWPRQAGEKGAIYIAGQRFEFAGDFDGLEGAIINIKQRLPKNVIDTSRDRTSLNKDDLESIATWLYDNMSKEDKIKFVTALEPVWAKQNSWDIPPLTKMLQRFLWKQKYFEDGPRAIHINFPKDKYVAYSDATDELVQELERKGYIVCHKDFASLGMQTIRELMGDARKHDPIQPTRTQLKKIAILKEALKKLAPSLEGKHFTPEELDTKIFLFDNKTSRESRLYSSALAEAITDRGVSKGFWIDKKYFDQGDFSEVLETALHELSHKAGGDESSNFSYYLTGVNQQALKQIITDPQTRLELRTLNKLWQDCNLEACEA